MDDKRNTTNLIKDIVFYYIKFYYDKILEEKNIKKLKDDEIDPFVDDLYSNNPNKIKKYIRASLKENQGEKYNKLVVENIIMEMFDDIDYAKKRVVSEIKTYQDNNKLGSE